MNEALNRPTENLKKTHCRKINADELCLDFMDTEVLQDGLDGLNSGAIGGIANGRMGRFVKPFEYLYHKPEFVSPRRPNKSYRVDVNSGSRHTCFNTRSSMNET
jgi:hypothetical protein